MRLPYHWMLLHSLHRTRLRRVALGVLLPSSALTLMLLYGVPGGGCGGGAGGPLDEPGVVAADESLSSQRCGWDLGEVCSSSNGSCTCGSPGITQGELPPKNALIQNFCRRTNATWCGGCTDKDCQYRNGSGEIAYDMCVLPSGTLVEGTPCECPPTRNVYVPSPDGGPGYYETWELVQSNCNAVVTNSVVCNGECLVVWESRLFPGQIITAEAPCYCL